MPFTPATLKFLRGLKKNNDREWFNQRRPIYESDLKAPMLALIEHINHAFLDFAPDFVRPPHKIMLRIFRDTRFAADKRPYKTHLSAWWGLHGMHKTSGAGFYLSLDATKITLAAGLFMPTPDQLLTLRRHLLDHHADYRRLLASKPLRAVFTPETPSEGKPLTRPPKGFPLTDPRVPPALDLLLHRRWGVSADIPADDPHQGALAPNLSTSIAAHFRLAVPLVHLLNTPFLASADAPSSFPSSPGSAQKSRFSREKLILF